MSPRAECTIIPPYATECKVAHSHADPQLNGTCSIGVNECASSPRKDGATCADSTAVASIPTGAYRCTCATGFADGTCAYSFIAQYKAQCLVTESTSAGSTLSGNCALDVDECQSSP
jgi:hypothetical protein